MENRRRVFKYILIFLFLMGTVNLYAQSSKFVQKLEWSSSRNAAQYKVEVRLSEPGSESIFYTTTNNYIEFSLPAGQYEYRVSVYDFLGRVSNVSEWRPFEIVKAVKPEVKSVAERVNSVRSADENIKIEVDISSVTPDSEVVLVNTESGEEVAGTLVINDEEVKAYHDVTTAEFPPVEDGNWKLRITNPGGLVSESPELVIGGTVAEEEIKPSEEIAEESNAEPELEPVEEIAAAEPEATPETEEVEGAGEEVAVVEPEAEDENIIEEIETPVEEIAEETNVEPELEPAEEIAAAEPETVPETEELVGAGEEVAVVEPEAEDENIIEEIETPVEEIAEETNAEPELEPAEEISAAEPEAAPETEEVEGVGEEVAVIESEAEEENIIEEPGKTEEEPKEELAIADTEADEAEAGEDEEPAKTKKKYRPGGVTLFGGVGYEYLLPFDGDLIGKFDKNPVLSYSVGLSIVPAIKAKNRFGIEAKASMCSVEKTNIDSSLKLDFISGNLSLVLHHQLIEDKLYLAGKAGGGIMALNYKVVAIHQINETYGYLSASAGTSLVWNPVPFMQAELGIDYNLHFIKGMLTNAFNGYVMLGLRL